MCAVMNMFMLILQDIDGENGLAFILADSSSAILSSFGCLEIANLSIYGHFVCCVNLTPLKPTPVFQSRADEFFFSCLSSSLTGAVGCTAICI